MFYKLIEKKRNQWLSSPECTVKDVIGYIEQRGKMRDAQLEAIKTFLFLKFHCHNRPLWELFSEGCFSDEQTLLTLKSTFRSMDVFKASPAAIALLEYSRLHNKKGEMLSGELEESLLDDAGKTDFQQAFRDIFYGIGYPDYLFSLPMGAGKTYLMAALIYLDLSFAVDDETNPLYAHNFMILAPSGKKTSIMPSLKNIMEFDPAWVLPEDKAAEVKRIIRFEILDEASTASGSNMVRNPNAQKINQLVSSYGDELMGLVAFTNAEKVILDRIDKESKDPDLFRGDEESRKENDRIIQANELRTVIGRIPQMAIFVDEVHHVAKEENKLRGVVTQWARTGDFKYMLGFSGTPYLESAEPVQIGKVTVKNTDLSNVVYHYPLLWAVGNFLKRPDIKMAAGMSDDIIRNGLNEFLCRYGDKVYDNGTLAKVAIYCTSIEQLEEEVYPQVVSICGEHGLDANKSILRFHGGNKKYTVSEEDKREFELLDSPVSRKRIVLLVKIGQEGWDCKSLTSVILSQKGACPTNLVLQTSCRCLREVIKNSEEHALIWLNEWNYKKLNSEFQKTQNTSIDELVASGGKPKTMVRRYDRTGPELLNVPPVKFYQMRIERTSTVIDETEARTAELLASPSVIVEKPRIEILQKDWQGTVLDRYEEQAAEGSYATLNQWLHLIAKESLNMTPVSRMLALRSQLESIFCQITAERDGLRYYRDDINQEAVRSRVRLAFVPKKTYHQQKEMIPKTARLLAISKEELEKPCEVESLKMYYPTQEEADAIAKLDTLPPEQQTALTQQAEAMRSLGLAAPNLHAERSYTYHYVPYRFDSNLERDFFTEHAVPLKELKEQGLEIYFNGDDQLTEFKIECYEKKADGTWDELGGYVPDFLVLQRNAEGELRRVLIIETKGEGFERNFAEKQAFMKGAFREDNNGHEGYPDFEFLFLPQQLKESHSHMLRKKIKEFFND
jgi:superfamily II DNA or RNA helicase